MDNLSLITCLCLILHQVHGYHKNKESDPQEIQTILDAHNYFRGIVTPSATDMYKMEWSEEAARNALVSVKRCKFAHTSMQERKISYPIESRCGENIFMSSVDTEWWGIVKDWDSEKADFVYGESNSDESLMVGHYTQLVWAKSHLVGCAKHFCYGTPYPYYAICQYCPSGNMMGKEHRPYESGRPCAACRDSCEGKLCKEKHSGGKPKPGNYNNYNNYNNNNKAPYG
uniref:SCP domain-containing protein n=1 Tax=Leptobrachium leishanense TaxID=445787 RepID=A0A8C5MQF2_9ANUR